MVTRPTEGKDVKYNATCLNKQEIKDAVAYLLLKVISKLVLCLLLDY